MKRHTPLWLRPFLGLLETTTAMAKPAPTITRLQGSAFAKVLVLAPLPTAVEYQRNLAWCDIRAELFFQYLFQTEQIQPNQFLIAPAVFFGDRPRVAETALGHYLIKQTNEEACQIRLIVCIGLEPFKIYFSRTKAPAASMLCGRLLRDLTETPGKTVLVTPSLDPWLAHGVPQKAYSDRREFYAAERAYRRLTEQITQLRLANRIAQYV